MATEKNNNNYADIFHLHLNKYAKHPVYEISSLFPSLSYNA